MGGELEKADLYKVLYPAFRFGLRRNFDTNTFGQENILDTPAIYAPNHIRFEDSLLVAAAYTEQTGRPLRFAAKQEYFDGRGIDDNGKLGRTARFLMEHTHMIPVDREAKDRHAFKRFESQVADRLADGDSVALHPEGTRSTDGRLHKFKSGAARIALAHATPIVPVGITYTQYSNKRKIHADITFGQPVMPDEYLKAPYSRIPGANPKAEHLIQVIEDRVSALTGMEQTGAFAQLRKLRHLRDGHASE